MSYATVVMLRHRLASAVPVRELVLNQPIQFDSDREVTFFSGDVEVDSVRVKAVRAIAPTRAAIALEDSVLLSAVPIVEGSVVVAADSSLGRVFTENLDFAVNYAEGTLTLKDGGELSAGMDAVIWYLPYYLYVSGSDYSLDAANGRLRRLSNGGIAVGERVHLDYRPRNAVYDETILADAVAEANGLVAGEVDPDRQFGADPALQAAAVYRALEIVSLSAATRQLSGRSDGDRAARAWIDLAVQFGERSRRYLDDFRPGMSGPINPTHS